MLEYWQTPEKIDEQRLSDQVVLVTGGGRNIGAAIALRCAAEGARIVVNDVDTAAAQQVCNRIEDAGGQGLVLDKDLSDFQVVDRAFEGVEEEFGLVTAVVNNAYIRKGVTSFGTFLNVTAEDWSEYCTSNLNLLFGPTQRFARSLVAAKKPGSIVNISSHGAQRAHRQHIPYDTVKGGVEAFTRAIAVDLAPWGIRANTIRPGAIEVDEELPMWQEKDDLRAKQIPLQRAGRPMDVAAAVSFLISRDASYITGQAFNVDGGLTTQGRAPQMEGVEVVTPANAPDFPSTLLG